jgi:hypothetical protein
MIALRITAQGKEGGEHAKKGGEGRRVVGHVSHSVKRTMSAGWRETGCEYHQGKI